MSSSPRVEPTRYALRQLGSRGCAVSKVSRCTRRTNCRDESAGSSRPSPAWRFAAAEESSSQGQGQCPLGKRGRSRREPRVDSGSRSCCSDIRSSWISDFTADPHCYSPSRRKEEIRHSGCYPRRWYSKQYRLFLNGVVQKKCSSSEDASSDLADQSQADLSSHRTEHGRRLQLPHSDAWVYRGPMYRSCLAGDEVTGTVVPDSCEAVVGSSRHLGLSANWQSRSCSCSGCPSPLSGRSVVNRSGLMAGCGRTEPGGQSSPCKLRLTHLTKRSRTTIHQVGRRPMDGSGVATPERLREPDREEEEAEYQEDSFGCFGRIQTSRSSGQTKTQTGEGQRWKRWWQAAHWRRERQCCGQRDYLADGNCMEKYCNAVKPEIYPHSLPGPVPGTSMTEQQPRLTALLGPGTGDEMGEISVDQPLLSQSSAECSSSSIAVDDVASAHDSSASLLEVADPVLGTTTSERQPRLTALLSPGRATHFSRGLGGVGATDADGNGVHSVFEDFGAPPPGKKDTIADVFESRPNVPGANASTMRASVLWDSLLRLAARSRCGRLRTFLLSTFKTKATLPKRAGPPGAVWPLPLPYPNGRSTEVTTEQLSFQRGVNAVVLMLNWLHLGQPGKVPTSYKMNAPLTGPQHAMVKRLERLMGEWKTAPPISAADMGRAASKVENLEEQIRVLTAAAETFTFSGSGKLPSKNVTAVPKPDSMFSEVQVAKEVESHRLKFAGRPSFDPAPYLEGAARECYVDPMQQAAAPADMTEDPPRVRVHGKRHEVLGLLKSLDATGRLALFTPKQVRMNHRAGLFALAKNLEVDRLILDSRPANVLEEGLSDWTQTMGSVAPLLQVVVGPDETIVASGEDLKDYYYYFTVTESRARRNAIAFQMSYAEAKGFSSFAHVDQSSTCFVPALRTMAMGDINAVEYGQQSHLRLALDFGVLQMGDLLTLRGRAPRLPVFAGLIIDDFIVFERVPRPLPEPEELVSTKVANAMAAVYTAVGLKANDSKRFRAETYSEFWGVSLDGKEGLLRAQVAKALPIAVLTSQIASLGAASRKLLEVLAGSWTAILQVRKRCMCLLDEIFKEIVAHDYNTVFTLGEDTIAELWSLVFLAPVFATDLKAQPPAEISLVDASQEWEAEVECAVPDPLAAELCRQSLTKAAWSKLLSPLKALRRLHGTLPVDEEVPDGEEPVRAHPVWTALARSQQFVLVGRKRVKARRHINLSELEAALGSESRRGQKQPNSRPLIGSDSQVVLGCLVKGRSSSSAINRRLRRAIPTIVGYNVYSQFQYVNTKDNGADDPTRDREVRAPCEDEPHWLVAAKAGHFEPLDQFLAEHGVGDQDIGRLPTYTAATKEPVDPVPEREHLRKSYVASQRSKKDARLNKPPVVARPRQPWNRFPLLSPTARALVAALPLSQFVFPKGADKQKLLGQQGHLDLFSGQRGAARALAERTGTWVVTFDIKHGPSEDLLDSAVRQRIEELFDAGAFASFGAGPVCSSFSRAVRPPVRTRACPRGLPNISAAMQTKVEQGNSFSGWLSTLVLRCLQLRVPFWVENPWLSFLWDQPEWQDLQQHEDVSFFLADYCRFGTPWRKRTKFLTNTGIKDQQLLCVCQVPHLHLKGYSSEHRTAWTKVAEAYPTALCRLLALAVSEALKPAGRQHKLDVASCARCCGRRIGEAAHPGPRLRRQRPAGTLEDVQRVQLPTLLIQRRVHEQYHEWLEAQLSAAVWFSVQANPSLETLFLRTYGNWLYQQGEPMYVFRHLVVLLQQHFPGDAHLRHAWDLLDRWEIAQPVSHRPPLPKLLLDAMVSLALAWNWDRWAAVTMLAFHGAMRIGEPLRARREDLMLAHEASLTSEICFLKISAPKAGRRGKGLVQHSRITDIATVTLAARVFGRLPGSELLYPASASTYRKRWDALLAALLVPPSAHLTPGCVRGGGAVFLYHTAQPLVEILWRMRLRHLTTLESYLQETAAENVVQKLPENCKRKLFLSAKFLPYFLSRVPPT